MKLGAEINKVTNDYSNIQERNWFFKIMSKLSELLTGFILKNLL